MVPMDRTKGNRHKLKHRKFPLNISKDFLSVRASKDQQSLPREIVASLSREKLAIWTQFWATGLF